MESRKRKKTAHKEQSKKQKTYSSFEEIPLNVVHPALRKCKKAGSVNVEAASLELIGVRSSLFSYFHKRRLSPSKLMQMTIADAENAFGDLYEKPIGEISDEDLACIQLDKRGLRYQVTAIELHSKIFLLKDIRKTALDLGVTPGGLRKALKKLGTSYEELLSIDPETVEIVYGTKHFSKALVVKMREHLNPSTENNPEADAEADAPAPSSTSYESLEETPGIFLHNFILTSTNIKRESGKVLNQSYDKLLRHLHYLHTNCKELKKISAELAQKILGDDYNQPFTSEAIKKLKAFKPSQEDEDTNSLLPDEENMSDSVDIGHAESALSDLDEHGDEAMLDFSADERNNESSVSVDHTWLAKTAYLLGISSEVGLDNPHDVLLALKDILKLFLEKIKECARLENDRNELTDKLFQLKQEKTLAKEFYTCHKNEKSLLFSHAKISLFANASEIVPSFPDLPHSFLQPASISKEMQFTYLLNQLESRWSQCHGGMQEDILMLLGVTHIDLTSVDFWEVVYAELEKIKNANLLEVRNQLQINIDNLQKEIVKLSLKSEKIKNKTVAVQRTNSRLATLISDTILWGNEPKDHKHDESADKELQAKGRSHIL